MENQRETESKRKRSPVISGFWAGFVGACMIGLAGYFGGMPEQLTALGIVVSSVMGLQLSQFQQSNRRNRQLTQVLEAAGLQSQLLFQPDLFSVHIRIARALNSLAESDNATLRNHAVASLSDLHAKISEMSEGKLVFENTETWRTVYERLLRKPEVTKYRSISWFRNAVYWQDLPGKKSLQLNCDLADSGLLIQRSVIAPASLWETGENLPLSPLLEWIEQQHIHGIWVKLVREEDLRAEPDLLVDLGIYGEIAVGSQLVDEEGRTSRFELDFRDDERKAAEAIWDRLDLFATSYAELLDREA
ncbi:hypothetical protein Enr13x_23350 [Stieleria neptunia]|uniref:Uncharacterized protein n=2 Tax=Stieleria neptunia TaxID=2527979 RepID=A0A518HNY0_9BACT|nr:hypothetical protein Enr13x_23350 [Stieleria neptunia]